MMQKLQAIIEDAYENRLALSPKNISSEIKNAVNEIINLLDTGKMRVAEKINGQWHTHQWLKKAILLYFRIHDNEVISADFTQFFDKVPLKFSQHTHDEFTAAGVRIVPNAMIRKGAYIAPTTVLMPSYVNIGAYIDTNTLIDTWATVGSCAQIGKNVHLSGGTGIGG